MPFPVLKVQSLFLRAENTYNNDYGIEILNCFRKENMHRNDVSTSEHKFQEAKLGLFLQSEIPGVEDMINRIIFGA